MGKQFTNFVEGTLNASVLTAATSIDVNFVTNGAVPTLSGTDYMLFVIDPEGAEHGPEVVKATAISGGSNPYTLTVTRAQESTTAQDWDSGRKIVAGVTAAQLDEIETSLAGKAASVHTHDDRYYTETEVDAFGYAKVTISTSAASGGSDGDVWFKY